MFLLQSVHRDGNNYQLSVKSCHQYMILSSVGQIDDFNQNLLEKIDIY